jgi:hypothetical protein
MLTLYSISIKHFQNLPRFVETPSRAYALGGDVVLDGGWWLSSESKRVSGSNNALYKDRGSIYMILDHRLIYSLVRVLIEVKEMKLTRIQKLWNKIGRIPTSTRHSRWSK